MKFLIKTDLRFFIVLACIVLCEPPAHRLIAAAPDVVPDTQPSIEHATTTNLLIVHADERTGPEGISESPFSASVIKDLSSSDYSDRHRGLMELEKHFANEQATWMGALAEDDEAAQDLTTSALFDLRLTSLLLHLALLPTGERQEQAKLLARADLFPLYSKLLSDDAGNRVEGVHMLAKIKDASINPLLIYFLYDYDIQVSIATLQIMWDHPPSDELIKTLWQVGIKDNLSTPSENSTSLPILKTTTFPDGIVVQYVSDMPPPSATLPQFFRPEFAPVACGVLAHWKGSQVEKLLNQTLNHMADMVSTNVSGPNNLTFWNIRRALANCTMIVERAHYLSSLPSLFRLTAAPLNQQREENRRSVRGRPAYYWSIRTSTLATIVTLTGQKPSDYGLKRQEISGEPNPQWTSSTKEGEAQAVEKLTTWWKEHSTEYGGHP